MRKFALIMVLALALPVAASARGGDKGDGTLVVKNARGQIVVRATGSALGTVGDGSIVVQDLSSDASDDIQVVGADQPKKVDAALGTVTYVGTKMRFRIIGGGYLLTVTGKGINVSAVGKGAAVGTDARDGQISADGVPFKGLTGSLVTVFGLQQ
jgi:hypothetical protein